jgi:drug/metabolite transporter (DMT)-like permease
MAFTGIFFALLATLSWSMGIFPFTQAARLLGVNPLNHFRLLLATILIAGVSAIVAPQKFMALFSSDYLPAWGWLGLSGIIGLTIGDYFGFAMFRILGARTGSILTTFAPAAALVLGVFLTNEHISLIGITGILITIAGVIGISLAKSERVRIPDQHPEAITKGIIYGVLAAICQGAGLVLARKGILNQEELSHGVIPLHATFIRLLTATASLFITTIIFGRWKEVVRPILANRDGGIRYAIAGTFFGPTFGVAMSLYTVALIDASVAQTIFSLVPAFAVVISFILHRERITGKALLGVAVAIFGVIILIWHDQLNKLL